MKRMTMLASAAIFVATLGTTTVVATDPVFISLDPAGVHLEDGATYTTGFGRHSGIQMPDIGSPSVAFGFTLPLNYTVGNTVYVGVFWHTEASTPCTAVLRPNFLSVARYGGSHIQGFSASSGFISNDGNNELFANGTNVPEIKVYTITRPDGTTELQPLDVINLGLFRRGDNADDTCSGDVTIQGLAIATL